MSATCRRHVSMSPISRRHSVSLQHRRVPDIPNLYQLQPTRTNQPKRTGTLAMIHFCLSSKELPTCNDMSAKADIVVSFWTPCRHDIFLCLRHDQRRVATCRQHDTECCRLGNKIDVFIRIVEMPRLRSKKR
jgi:hypothetical protein